jgi:hypothetical protein
MNIQRRLERLEEQASSAPGDLCQCPIDPSETWETVSVEEFAREWSSNTCRKCGQSKLTEAGHAVFTAQLNKVYGGNDQPPWEAAL